jgi:vacuolar-type H+-ATPase catalytic subunit A/Vma1
LLGQRIFQRLVQRHIGRQRDAVIDVDAVGVDAGGPVAAWLQQQTEAVVAGFLGLQRRGAQRRAAALPTAKVPVSIGVFTPFTTEKWWW